MIPSEDNCSDGTYNPDQRWPFRITGWDFINNVAIWTADETGKGVLCEFDINNDGTLTAFDAVRLAERVNNPLYNKPCMVGDYDCDGAITYSRFAVPKTGDVCVHEAALIEANVTISNLACPP